MLTVQAALLEALDYGFTPLPTKVPLHSLLFFAGFRILLQFVAASRNAEDLRRAAARRLRLRKPNVSWNADIRSYENLDVDARREVAVLTGELLREWPSELLRLSRESRMNSSDITGRIDECPYWLESVVDQYLYAGTYSPTLPEIRNAIAYLKRRGRDVSKAEVSRLLAVTDALRKRQLRFMLNE